MVVETNKTGEPIALECKQPDCGHKQDVPIDIAMKIANAPELPDF